MVDIQDRFTEKTPHSWLNRFMSSIGGTILGIVFFIGAFPLIWWNEGQSVERIKTLNEADKAAISVSAEALNPSNNDKLIHVSGRVNTDDVLKDTAFGVEENALKLYRKVEMYQWDERKQTRTQKDLGGGETQKTTYEYEKIWSENLINSDSFKRPKGYKNPASMPFSSRLFSGSNVTLGAFNLSNSFISQLSDITPLEVTKDNFKVADRAVTSNFKLYEGQYFKGDPADPTIGAVRVSYSLIKPHTVSVIGQQKGDIIDIYESQNGTIELLQPGILTVGAMIKTAESENKTQTWIVRGLAFILMWFGLVMTLRPIQVLSDVIPFLGNLIGLGIGLAAGLVTVALSFATMALAWLFYRPVIGAALLAVTCLVIYGGFWLIMRKAKREGVSTALERVEPQPELADRDDDVRTMHNIHRATQIGAQPYQAQTAMPPQQAFIPPSPVQTHGIPEPQPYPVHSQAQAQAQAPYITENTPYTPYAEPPQAPAPQHYQPQPYVPVQNMPPHYAPPQQVGMQVQPAYSAPHASQRGPTPHADRGGYPSQNHQEDTVAQTESARLDQNGQPTKFVPQPYIPPH